MPDVGGSEAQHWGGGVCRKCPGCGAGRQPWLLESGEVGVPWAGCSCVHVQQEGKQGSQHAGSALGREARR